MPNLVITCRQGSQERAWLKEALDDAAQPVWLTDLDDAARAEALRTADIVLARNTGQELRLGEADLLGSVRLIQFMTAGVDYVPLNTLPAGVPIASNGGAYAEPMAEHALAMTLAAAKRLLIEHNALARGEFNQFKVNRAIEGMTCGILGFGGSGKATARLMRAVGMRIHAINRSGTSDAATDWIGTDAQLDELLAAADVLVISVPLTPATEGIIGARELGLMKADAILVNLARGEVVDEAALFSHLQTHSDFIACIDAWWVEPVRHGTFRTDHPFLSLQNVIGSPHNSAAAPRSVMIGVQRAIANIRRVLNGETPLHPVADGDRMM